MKLSKNKIISFALTIIFLLTSLNNSFFSNFSLSEKSSSNSFTDNYKEYVIDINNDTIYDYLVIEVEVNITEYGNFSVNGKLIDGNKKEIETSYNISILDVGLHNITLKFNGTYIYSSEYNGSFQLVNLYLENATTYPYPEVFDSSSIAYNTSFYNYTDFQPPPIIFSNKFSDSGIDDNYITGYEYLRINTTLNSSVNGSYIISASLYDSKNRFIDSISNTIYLSNGTQNITLDFDYSMISLYGSSGKFYLKGLVLYDTNYKLITWSNANYTTSSYDYTQFEIPKTSFTNSFSDYGIDSNDNGKYEFLTIEVEVNINESGTYRLEGLLYDKNGEVIDFSGNLTELNQTRLQNITLHFDGRKIYQHGLLNESYELKDLKLFDYYGTLIDEINFAYTTKNYNYTDFEKPIVLIKNVSSEYGNDLNNDGRFEFLTFEVYVEVAENGTYKIGSYLYDENNSFVAYTISEQSLRVGNQIIIINFDGKKIAEYNYTGKYLLATIEVYDENDTTIGKKDMDYLTKQYNSTNFQESPKPDLFLTSSDISFSEFKNGKITITAVIRNKGNADATFVIVKFYNGSLNKKGEVLGIVIIPRINLSSSSIAKFEWNTTKGEYFIWVEIDPDNRIEELNEDNNIVYQRAEVSEKKEEGKNEGAWKTSNILYLIGFLIIIAMIIIAIAFNLKLRKKEEK